MAQTKVKPNQIDEASLDVLNMTNAPAEANADVTDATNVGAAGAPIITSGAGVPSSTPTKVGDIYVDTTNDNVYVATDTSSSADWDQATGAGGGDALTSNPLSQFAATTSAQLAGVLSDETGSGAAVFATSPTLVTPALGTPSSGTLTNCTGLPQAGTVGLTTSSSPQFTAVNVGHATDTTIARSSAGNITVEGNIVYRAGGTDVPVTDGGTGRSTSTTAYGLIAAGTTATGAHQTLAAGATTQILVGGGASALPSWTTATGSGAPVRATSPTLVTPLLGTPTSGTLTNCTGLPVAGITASTSTALGVGSVELGHATDTTIARSAAGVITVEGNKVIMTDGNTAELDMGANSIGFTMQTATGDGTTTIDWKLGNHFDFTFGAFNETFTFTAPTNPGVYTLSLKQDSVGSRTATWPATVKWPGGTAPTLTTTATTGYDILSFRFDGTNYYGTSTLNFS